MNRSGSHLKISFQKKYRWKSKKRKEKKERNERVQESRTLAFSIWSNIIFSSSSSVFFLFVSDVTRKLLCFYIVVMTIEFSHTVNKHQFEIFHSFSNKWMCLLFTRLTHRSYFHLFLEVYWTFNRYRVCVCVDDLLSFCSRHILSLSMASQTIASTYNLISTKWKENLTNDNKKKKIKMAININKSHPPTVWICEKRILKMKKLLKNEKKERKKKPARMNKDQMDQAN